MKEIGRVLLGSNNYRLNGPESDEDYKVFLCPDFSDLYRGHKVEKNDLPAKYDKDYYSPMDVRTFNQKLLKGNINCLEYVFSIYKVGDMDFYNYMYEAEALFNSGYAMCCWDSLFASAKGLMMNSLDRNGVNRKTMSRAYYFYMFLMTAVTDDFCIDGHTWRGNDWTNRLRAMRFDESTWMPTRGVLENSFDYLEQKSKEKVERLKQYNKENYDKLVSRGETLNQTMYDLVKKRIMEDTND